MIRPHRLAASCRENTTLPICVTRVANNLSEESGYVAKHENKALDIITRCSVKTTLEMQNQIEGLTLL